MIRKITTSILTVAMLAACCAGCASYTDGAATTGYAFVQKMADQDYVGAYEYIYSFTNDVQSKEDFVQRFENIYSALGVTDVTLMSRNVEEIGEGEDQKEYKLTYTFQIASDLLGTKSYDFEAEIFAGPLGYAVIYSPSLILPQMEEGDKVRVLNQTGTRGEVFSSDGKMLARNDYAQSIYVDLDMNPDFEKIRNMLVATFGLDAEKLQKKYDNAVEKGYPLEVLATFPRDTLTRAQIEQINELDGLGVDDERLSPIRYYPLGDNAAHVVGYMGSPTEAQVAALEEKGETVNNQVGQLGIESSMEDTLKGTDGRIIYIENNKGDIKEVLWEDAKSDGSDIYLTIDTTLQNMAYTLLAANCSEGQSGAVVVMDYTNGDVKAMVSYPSFDNNLFNFPIDSNVWDYYQDEANLKPLFPRATQAAYMPGSAFKPFSCVPNIEQGGLYREFEPPITVEKNAWMPQMTGWHFPAIKRVEEPKGEDWSFDVAMKSSDNIYFAYLALQTGVPDFMEYMRKIGMGTAPEFELPINDSNLLNADTEEVSLHLLAEMGYGNGQLEISPIQMACMYTAFENGGDMLNPTIVKKISKTVDNVESVEWENSKTIFIEGAMQPSTIEFEKDSLRRVFTDGTAYAGKMSDVSGLYGKTGTARMNDREVNWIIAINPNNNLLYLVVLDTGLDVGSAPKLAIMHGLVKPENYNSALRGTIVEISDDDDDTSTPTQAPDDSTQTREPDTTNEPEPTNSPDPEPDTTTDPDNEPTE